MIDMLRLYEDYSVDYVTEGHKHTRPGWINTECPWCEGNIGYHLGWNVTDGYFHCWRCGGHHTIKTLALLLHLSEKETKRILQNYGGRLPATKESVVKVQRKAFKLPSNLSPLLPSHRMYLKERGFEPETLIKKWKLQSTGPISILDNINYNHRIFIPIVWNGKVVSFTTRDVTECHPLKYISCPKSRELICHKEILYGLQDEWHDFGICVEGPTDVWRLGNIAFATFGIQYTLAQVRVMAKTFRRIAVLYDNDPQATIQADKLVAELRFRGVEAFRIECIEASDPGNMSQKEADYLVKQMLS